MEVKSREMNGSGLEVEGPPHLVKEGLGLMEGEELLVHPIVYRAHVVVAISIIVSGIKCSIKTRTLGNILCLILHFSPFLFILLFIPFSSSLALTSPITRSASSFLFASCVTEN